MKLFKKMVCLTKSKMAQKPETRLIKKILKCLQSEFPGFYYKTHGNMYQKRGLPDIIGCYEGDFIGLEVKMPGKEPTAIQCDILSQIEQSGGNNCVVHSVEEALDFMYDCYGSK